MNTAPASVHTRVGEPFASILHLLIGEPRFSVELLHHHTGIALGRIAEIESGRSEPTWSEATALLEALRTGVGVLPLANRVATLPPGVLEPLRLVGPDRPRAHTAAGMQRLGVMLDAAVVENLQISPLGIRFLADGVSTDEGTPAACARIRDLLSLFDQLRWGAHRGSQPRLVMTTPRGLVTADGQAPHLSRLGGEDGGGDDRLKRAARFYLAAVVNGGDPTVAFMLFNGALLAEGYPILMMRKRGKPTQYSEAVDYLRATGDGIRLLTLLVSTAKESGVYV